MPVHEVLQLMCQQPVVVRPGRSQDLAVEKDGLASVASRRHGGRVLIAPAEVAARAVQMAVKDANPRVRVHPRRPLAAETRMNRRIDDALEVRSDALERAVRDGDTFLYKEVGMVRDVADGCPHRSHRGPRQVENLEVVAVPDLVPERHIASQPRGVRRNSAITMGEIKQIALRLLVRIRRRRR